MHLSQHFLDFYLDKFPLKYLRTLHPVDILQVISIDVEFNFLRNSIIRS